jgi:rhodanese-related sulfurtransferase
MSMKLRDLLIAAGFLVAAIAIAAEPVAVPTISQDSLVERQQQHDPVLFVLDVRTPEEFAGGHVPGAVNIPHDQVASRLAEVPKDRDVVVYCRSGRRAGLAAEVLKASGFKRVQHLEGDMEAWLAKGRPVETLAQDKTAN